MELRSRDCNASGLSRRLSCATKIITTLFFSTPTASLVGPDTWDRYSLHAIVKGGEKLYRQGGAKLCHLTPRCESLGLVCWLMLVGLPALLEAEAIPRSSPGYGHGG